MFLRGHVYIYIGIYARTQAYIHIRHTLQIHTHTLSRDRRGTRFDAVVVGSIVPLYAAANAPRPGSAIQAATISAHAHMHSHLRDIHMYTHIHTLILSFWFNASIQVRPRSAEGSSESSTFSIDGRVYDEQVIFDRKYVVLVCDCGDSWRELLHPQRGVRYRVRRRVHMGQKAVQQTRCV